MQLTVGRSAIACVAASSVVVGLLVAPPRPAAASSAVDAAAGAQALSRPDVVSAQVVARASGRRVLVTGLSTEVSSTWVNPDGSFSSDVSSVPVQAQVSTGVWQPIDDTLTTQPDGSVAPAVSVTGVRFAGPGSSAAARLGAGLASAGLDWLSGLPAPVLAGDTAIYPGVLSGTDLAVTATATGFELSLVVKAKPAKPLPTSVSLPLRGSGLVWSLSDAGVLSGADATGRVLVTSAGAAAYDASRDQRTGQPLHSTPLQLALTGSVGAQRLTVTLPNNLLTDPGTVFPVTIDPSTSWSKTAHTYVDSGFATTSYYNANVLLGVGTYNAGSNKNRTMFAFNTAGILGKHVISATINLNEAGSWSCTAQPFDLWSVGAFSSSTTWNTQPAVNTKYATITAAKGYSSACPAGNVTGDVTGWGAAVAAGSNATSYLELRAQSETDNNQWKKFNPAAIVSLTYNSYPGQPTGRTVSPCSAQCSAPTLTNTPTPSLGAYTTDPDGQTLRYYYEVYAGTSPSPTTLVSSGSSAVAPGSAASWKPSGLTNGSSYEYRVRAWDGIDYGPWSAGYVSFTVDTSAPVAPSVSSSTHPANTLTSATTGTFSWSDTSTDKYQYAYQLDGRGWSAWTSATTVTLAGITAAPHTFSVRVDDKAGNISPAADYVFNGGLLSPQDQDRTQQLVQLAAAGPSADSYVKYQWRASTTGTWADVPPGDVTVPAPGSGHPSGWPQPIASSWTWNLAATAGGVDGMVQVRACLMTSSSDPSPACQDPASVQLAAHAFGASYATDGVGPGTVSLATGDFSVSATDVDIASYLGSLSIARSLTTLAPAGETTGPTGVFGPGWTAALSGPDAGAADLTPVDHASQGYLLLTDADGGSSAYRATSPLGSYPITFTGLGDAADGSVLRKVSASSITLTDTDGTVTSWEPSGSSWRPQTVQQAASNSTTSYSYDTNGDVARILGAVPTGISCATPDSTPGCRSLLTTYTTIAGHPRLASVALRAYDPAAGAMTSTTVAAYDYDSAGTLIDEYDPRISPNLKTAYTYDSNGRLATLTPPGLAAWTMHYDGAGRLSSVTRPDPALSQTQTTTISYGVPLTGTGLPDLSAASSWGQATDQPETATAVFGPEYVPAGTPTGTDWPYASISYLDVNGRVVDTAGYGAGDWQLATSRYDQQGNTVWSLTPGNRVQALTPTTDTDPEVAALPYPAQRADLLATSNVYNTDPTGQFGGDSSVLLDSYGPQHPVLLADGTTASARSHTHTDYDQGKPAGGGDYRLPTTVTTSALLSDGTDRDPVITRTGYDPIGSGDASGWDLKQPTSSTTQLGTSPSSADLVRVTRYNLAGQVIESRLANSAASGGDAGTTVTNYYTAGSSGSCVSNALAGLPCTVAPAAPPSTGNPLPTQSFTYNLYNQATVVTDTAGSTVRTTTSSYDAAGRSTGSAIAVTPTAAGGTALPAVTTGYDPGTGLPTTVSNGTGTLTTGYDSLGRVISYTDAGANTATTSYDIAGRPATVNDGKGTYTYTYDQGGEHRGLLTTLTLGVGSAPGSFTASYNPDGGPATQTYPNGLVATTRYDNTANPTSLDYGLAGTSWLTFTQNADVHGWTRTQTSPASRQAFSYDNAGRLTITQDTAITGSTAACTTRLYGLDRNSNRTSLTSYPDDGSDPANGHCTTATTPSTTNSSYDQADRLTNTGYTYDTLGRTSTVPAVDAVGIGSHSATTGSLSIGYYSNDRVASQTQGGRSLGFTLDPLQNRTVDTTDTAGATSTNHYANSSDSPAWTSTGSNWTRNLLGPDGGLTATIDQTGTVTLQLANMHGDLVAAVPDDPAATGPTSYNEATEYGAPRTPASAPDTYGWLGAKQRSSNDLAGLTLMGARLYNPTTGRFLSVDPVPGGNDNPYVYVTNPTDQTDLNGRCWRWCNHAWNWSKKHWRGIAQTGIIVAGAVAAGVCVASVACGLIAGATIAAVGAGGLYAAGNAGSNRWRWRSFAVAVAVPYVTAGLSRWAGALSRAVNYAARHRLW
jgi:RHS repeat-associated protein